LILFVQEIGQMITYGYYTPHWIYVLFYIMYPIVLVSTLVALLKKQKALWATILFFVSSIVFFGIGVYRVIRYASFDNVYILLISCLAFMSSIFAFVARPLVLNEQVTLEDNSNEVVHIMAEVKLDEPKLKEEKVDDFDEEEAQKKLAKLKKLYQQGLIREEEYKKYVVEIVSKL
jgi:FlaA1/EpsC-like NDP-sugar epimerase